MRARLGGYWSFAGLFRIGWADVDAAAYFPDRPVTFLVIIRADSVLKDVSVATELAVCCHEIFARYGTPPLPNYTLSG